MIRVAHSGSSFRPMPGLSACGDAVVELRLPDDVALFAVIDGLGHGPDAEASAKRVCEVLLTAEASSSLKELFTACDKKLVGMRGVVMSALRVARDGVVFAGVGNVEIVGPPGRSRPLPMSGVLGRGNFRFREWAMELSGPERWYLASDGVKMRGVQQVLEKLKTSDAGTAAQELIRLAGREDDDASAIALDFAVA